MSNTRSASDTTGRAPILAVDATPANLDAIEALLAQSDCRLVRAYSADEALRAVVEHDFAAIILDIKMAGMSGIELADVIKTHPRSRHTPILFLTAHAVDERVVLRVYETGAVDYLTKPIHADILRSKIAVFVELFRKTRALGRANEALRREASERARAEEALRRVNQELEGRVLERTQALERADRRKDEFLAVLGHELRNPLAPIVSAVEVLEGEDATSLERGKARDVLRRQVRQMTRLIEDLMDVGRITSDRLVLRRSVVELSAVVATAVETSRSAMNERGHQLTIKLPPQPLRLNVDATRLSQVLSNLLSNATKYTDPGGEIRIAAELEPNGLVVRVRDTGIGIEPSVLPTIFDLFVQVDHAEGAAEHGGGLGIGLALARRLVEMHGGRLVATSAGLGQGSEFSVWLPLSAVAQASAPVPRPAMRPEGAPPQRVLIVDDNEDAADMLTVMLTGWGHEAKPAYNSTSALDVAEEFHPNVVLLDLGLPGLDGYGLAEQLRKRPWANQLALFAVTGRGQDYDRARTRVAGFQEHFVKPVPPETLRQALTRTTN